MSLTHVSAPDAPGNPAVYTQAVVTGNLVFCSGAIGLDPTTVRTPHCTHAPHTHNLSTPLTHHHPSSPLLSTPREQKAFNSDTIEGQTAQTLKNLTAVLTAAGASLSSVVKVTIYLVDMQHYAAVNTLYTQHFTGTKPARTCIAVSQLPLGALIEIEAVAVLAAK